jgi:uncharacterized repeat protein (TIGR02543 family)
MKKRFLSLFLTISVFMSLMPVYVQAEETIFEETGISYISISDAGAARSMAMPWASCRSSKGSVMFPVTSIEPDGDTEPVEYFFRASDTPTMHLLTLYGSKPLDMSEMWINGVRAAGVFSEKVYGDEDEEVLYCYTIPMLVHSSNCEMYIFVNSKQLTSVRCTHIPDNSPRPLVTDLYPYEYTENSDGYLSSFTVKISGFSMPTDKSAYKFARQIDSEPHINTDFAECTEVSEKDDYGMFTLTFELTENLGFNDLIWLDLLINDKTPYFFCKTEHLAQNTDDTYYFNDYEGGSNARIASPYYAANGGTTAVKIPTLSVPTNVTATPVSVSITPNDYEGGQIAYSTDSGETFSSWQNIGTSISVPLTNGNGSYGIVFKFKKDGFEEKKTGVYNVTLAIPDKDPEILPTVSIPETTLTQTITATISAGSFAGGKMSWCVDGDTWTDFIPVSNTAQITLPDTYGQHSVCFAFRKDGIKSYTSDELYINYTDGKAVAPTSAGITDLSDNSEITASSGIYQLCGNSNTSYRFYATAPANQALEAIFRDKDGKEIVSKNMTYSNSRYEVNADYAEIKSALSVAFRVKAGNDGISGHELVLNLKISKKGYIKEIYAPSVPFTLSKDGLQMYRNIAPNSTISGVFETALGDEFSQRITLTYIADDNSTKSTFAPALPDKNGQASVSLTLPDDVKSLVSIDYELLKDGKIDSKISYPMSLYRVSANTSVIGIPKSYIGTTFTLKGANVEKYVVLTEDNYAEVELGDLPTGSYNYEITGLSGHIVGGELAITRNNNIILSALPELGSVTVTTTGFTSENTGDLLNPPAAAILTLTTPDGTTVKIQGTQGVKMEQIPVGSIGSAEISYDEAAYDEIQGFMPKTQDITVAGDENIAFTYKPYTYRTIKGGVWGVKTYPNGRTSGFVPAGTKIVVTQEVTRGGKTETIVQTATPNYAGTTSYTKGKWSVKCYDDIPAKVEVKSLTWNTETIPVTESGNVNLGTINMSYGGEKVIELKAEVETPASINEDGSNHYSSSDSVKSTVDSTFIGIDFVSAGSKTYRSSDGAYEVTKEGGRTFLKLKEGVVVGNEDIYIRAYGNTEFGNMSLSLGVWGQDVRVKEDSKTGNPIATFTATNLGGELRATVVDDADSGYTGFLVVNSGLNSAESQCIFTMGTGELRLPYSVVMTTDEKTVLAVMVRNEDVDAMVEILNSNCKQLFDMLPQKGNLDSEAFFRLRDYDRKIKYKKIWLPQNRYLYLDGMQPTMAMGAELLPPYKFTYHYTLSDNPNKVWMIGTLEKRFPDIRDQDQIRSFQIFVPTGSADSEELGANTNFYVNGREMSPLNEYTWMSDYCAKANITAEIPLGTNNVAAFSIKMKTGGLNSQEQVMTYREHIPMFTIVNPGDVYIADQLKTQKLNGKSEEVQAGWKLNLAMRAYSTDDDDENIITIYDNGIEIKKINVSRSKYVYNDTGESIILGGSLQKIPVTLTDNLSAGIHVVWAERTLHGELMQTEPVVFSLIEGAEHNEVYISELSWTHWNSRIPGKADEMYFENLSDIAGENIWIWPGKRHQMQFKVNNATSKELEGVTLAYKTLEAKSWSVPAGMTDTGLSGLTSLPVTYVTTTKRIPCKLINEDRNANYSIWGFDDEDMGYLQGFEFEFQYNAALEKDLQNMDVEELDNLETEAFYHANGMGELPDLDALAEGVSKLTEDERKEVLGSMSETTKAFDGLDVQITEDNDKSFKAELKTPTDEISEYSFSVKENGTMDLPEIWLLMENERENGNQNPDEAGWDVNWSEFDTKQGSMLIRTATFAGELDDGRGAILSHTTYYITKSVADKLFASNTKKNRSANLMAKAAATTSSSFDKVRNILAGEEDYSEAPTHWTKNVYDVSSFVYCSADIGFNGLKDLVWLDYKISGLSQSSGTYQVYEDMKNWGDNGKFAKGASRTFQVLGVADAVMTYANGPSGNDPASLRALLSLVKDEKARQSLEWQIKDYEELRDSIYKSDCTYSTANAIFGFVPGGIVAKVGLFVGGLVNTYLSNDAKKNNGQVYNSTLHDIRLQIEIERRREEYYKKSLAEANQWMRDRMDHFYGKGKWSQYALEEELKYWVLVKFPNGTVKYVWHEKVPNFDVYIDPSGYVFEGAEDNPVENVTTTLYYSDTEDGNYSVWKDTSPNNQPNPQYSAEDGRYGWMVPVGWWKVRYEKEGYQTAESKPMSVPPIHTAVNIGLLSTEAPKATVAARNGKIYVLFSRYMQLESLINIFGDEKYTDDSFNSSEFAVHFYDKNNSAISGTVTFPDKVANLGYTGTGYGQDIINSDWFVRTAVFTPDTSADLSSITQTFSSGIASYSGVALSNTPADNKLVILNANGGTLSVPSLITNESGYLSSLPSPVYENHTFDGWYTSKTGGEKVTLETRFTENAEIFAHWTEIVTETTTTGHSHRVVTEEKKPDDADDGEDSNDAEDNTPVSNPFTDVKADDYFYDAILWAVKNNITSGTSKETFSPEDTCTRAQTLTFLWRAAGEPEPKTHKNPFDDMAENDYFYKAVLWAYENGITAGTEEGKFSPEAFVDRAQTVTFLYRLAGEKTNNENPFSDVKKTDYYYNPVIWAYENGITAGTDENSFSPSNDCLRAQIVTLLYRYYREK